MIIRFAPTETNLMTITQAHATIEPTAEIIPFKDLRKDGLKSVGQSLSANRGDLGEVFEARAKADIFYCPVCPEPHKVA